MSERFETRQAVFVLLRNPEGELLLQQRAGHYLAGYYDCTASGHVELGESLQQTAVRELQEEAGVTAKESDLRLIHVDQYYLKENYINWTFLLEKWQGEPTIMEPEKCSDLRYFKADESPEKCVNNLRAVARAGITGELTFSVTNYENYEALMGEPFELGK